MTLHSLSQEKNFPRPFNENYELLGVLGQGGMGYVYKAKDLRLQRDVALKVLDASSDKEAIERFYLEARAMKELDHQNIVHVFDFGEHKKQLFIAMTYVEGTSLAEVLRNKSKLDFGAIELLAKQTARGLLFAHSKGIVHRDVKPSNIMLTHDNRVYLMDFGISYIQELEKERLTMTGMAMGTPEYMSPEQCHGDEVTLSSDIYSLGVILYEMTCGRLPFIGAKPIEIALKHVQEAPPAPEIFRPNIPLGLSKLILKCLEKKPENRFRDMEEFLDAVDAVFEQNKQQKNNTEKTRTPLLSQSLLRESVQKIIPLQKRLMLSGMFLFPLIIILMIALMLLYRPSHTLEKIAPNELHGAFLEKSIEPENSNYTPENLFDGDIHEAWIFPKPANKKNPILTMQFKKTVLITHIGFASGYQKSVDDGIGDRFNIYNKPKTLFIKTKEGMQQEIRLEDVRGMQYPPMNPLETSEIQLYLSKSFVSDTSQAYAISEMRFLGMELQ